MNKVVYNACYGGFSISDEAVSWIEENYGKKVGRYYYRGDSRHSEELVKCVEALGKEANGDCASLKIAEISSNLYYIDEYDGSESVITPDTTFDWVEIE